jgi:hypothetical protein
MEEAIVSINPISQAMLHAMDDMTEADWAAIPNPVYPNV